MAKIDDSVKKEVPELRFKGFTDDWEKRKLGELANIVGGGTPSTSNPEYWDGDIDWYAPAEIGEQSYVSKSKKTITELGLKNSSARILPVGTVLFTSRAGIGNTAILAKEATTNQGFQSIVPDQNKLDSYFIFSRTNELKRYGEVTGAGSTFVEVSGKQMSKMSIMVPELSEQQKIGSFFKQLDETIALHQHKLDLLKEQKKGFLQKMFPKNGAKVPELRFAGFADDWEEHKLGEVIDIENGYAFKSEYFSDEEKRHIVLTPGSVKIGGGFQKDKGRYYDVSGVFPEKFIFKPGDIFITMTDLTPTAQSLGYPAIVPRDDNVYLHNQRLGKIINTTINPEFLYTLLTTDTYHKEIVSSASGTTVKHSSVSKILDFKSAIPNIDEQKLIGAFFKHLDDTIALHQRKLDLLKEQKKGFLQKMFI